jgi:hypothetical protein
MTNMSTPQTPPPAPPSRLVIGIDPGVNTGLATWDPQAKRLVRVESMPIHVAMAEVKAAHESGPIRVRYEDARQRRTWFGKLDAKAERYGAGVREGVGSVKRDAAIWEAYLRDLGVDFEAVKPAVGATKWPADHFQRVTGWTKRTNEHGRDAALLVLGAR